MFQRNGLGFVLADGFLGCLSGLFGGFLRCLGGSFFGGRGCIVDGAVIFLFVGEDLAGGHMDAVVVFVVIVAELHIVRTVFPVVFDLGVGGLVGGHLCMLQGDLQSCFFADRGGLVGGLFGGGFRLFGDDCLGGLDIKRSRLHGFLGPVGSGAAGGQEQCKNQSKDSDGLFHGSRLLSDMFN